MKYEIKNLSGHQELKLYDFHFIGSYDEGIFYNTLYTANIKCFFESDFIVVSIPNELMYWQANHIRQIFIRYSIPIEAIKSLEGISTHNF